MTASQPSSPVASALGSSSIEDEKEYRNSRRAWSNDDIRTLLEHRAKAVDNRYSLMVAVLGRSDGALRLQVLVWLKKADKAADATAIHAAEDEDALDPEKPPSQSGEKYAEENRLSAQRALDHFLSQLHGPSGLNSPKVHTTAEDADATIVRPFQTLPRIRVECGYVSSESSSSLASVPKDAAVAYSPGLAPKYATMPGPSMSKYEQAYTDDPSRPKVDSLHLSIMMPSGLPRLPAVDHFATQAAGPSTMLAVDSSAPLALLEPVTVPYPDRTLPPLDDRQMQAWGFVENGSWGDFKRYRAPQAREPATAASGPVSSLTNRPY